MFFFDSRCSYSYTTSGDIFYCSGSRQLNHSSSLCSSLRAALGITCFAYRDLRRQLRIQIHLQFFAALLLSNAASLMWYVLVHYDLLTSDVMASTVVARNQVRSSTQAAVRRSLQGLLLPRFVTVTTHFFG